MKKSNTTFIKSFFILSLLTLITSLGCSKKDLVIGQASPSLTQKPQFTSADATTAFNSFNSNFYNTTEKLYYSTTEKNDIGSIWTQAIYWDMVMNAYQRTKNPDYLKMINDIYEGGLKRYDGYNFENTTVWFIYDDIMWWVIAFTNAYKITGNPVYLEKAKAGFERVWSGSYDPIKGGMFWDFQHSGKNSCINYPTVIAATKLYEITKNETYLNKAKDVYSWSRANLFNTENGRVADNKIGDGAPGYTDYTYNYGTCIGSALELYNLTKTESYLKDAKLCASYVKNSMCDANGILPEEGDWNEQGVLKAILAQYLYQLLPLDTELNLKTWIATNINSAWQNRDQVRGIMHRNYKIPCPKGVVQSYESSSAVAFMQLFEAN